jgi:thiamine-phosphate pyrophosphorylase
MTGPDVYLAARLRIIDANLNRAGEGLHLLEEVARLILDDAALAGRLKYLRHEVVRADWLANRELLQARDAAGDVGRDARVAGESKERNLMTMVVANARRVQEALRILEEMSKTPGVSLDSEKFKLARFESYTIERVLVSKLLRQDKAARIAGLYAVLDSQYLAGRSYLDLAAGMIAGGVKIIQLRDKLLPKPELLAVARDLQSRCRESEVLFIVNDYLDIALAVGADGVHLGQGDLPVADVRRLMPVDRMVGCSVKTLEQAKKAEADGADYVSVGAMFSTESKDDTWVVGPAALRKINTEIKMPLVAIGGINKDNAIEVMAAGADAVAVIGAILKQDDITAATRLLVEALQ